MKTVGEMTIGELAAFVCTHLEKNGINVVLSGGACVSLFTENEYQSFDLDFIENVVTSRKRIREVLQKIGFIEEHRYYKHPDTDFFLEFPPGPLSIGDEPVREIMEKEFSTGVLRLLSPTDCVKDRLTAYYHWNDQPGLEQAILVCLDNKVDLDEVERWSINEGLKNKFEIFKKRLNR